MRGGRWPELKMKRSWYTLALTDSLYDGQFETRTGGLTCMSYITIMVSLLTSTVAKFGCDRMLLLIDTCIELKLNVSFELPEQPIIKLLSF